MAVRISFTLNGSPVQVQVEIWESLFDVLRSKLGVRGVKTAMCGSSCAACGACTVLMDGRPIYSVMTPAYRADGRSIMTVEGLAGPEGLHPLQEAFVENYAVQCGFCTSGMLMSAKALLDANPSPTEEEIREALRGNLCRCTGYVKIIDAVKAASKVLSEGGGGGGGEGH